MIHFVHANNSHDFELDAINVNDGAADAEVIRAVVDHAASQGLNVAGVDARSYNLYRNENTNDLTVAPSVKYGSFAV